MSKVLMNGSSSFKLADREKFELPAFLLIRIDRSNFAGLGQPNGMVVALCGVEVPSPLRSRKYFPPGVMPLGVKNDRRLLVISRKSSVGFRLHPPRRHGSTQGRFLPLPFIDWYFSPNSWMVSRQA
ncbi:MAG: hypothetical protein ACREXV_15355 [Polaromonas sp.]